MFVGQVQPEFFEFRRNGIIKLNQSRNYVVTFEVHQLC